MFGVQWAKWMHVAKVPFQALMQQVRWKPYSLRMPIQVAGRNSSRVQPALRSTAVMKEAEDGLETARGRQTLVMVNGMFTRGGQYWVFGKA